MQEVWIPEEPMDPGAGFGRHKCAELLVGGIPWSDLEFTPKGPDSQASMIIGMHVRLKYDQIDLGSP